MNSADFQKAYSNLEQCFKKQVEADNKKQVEVVLFARCESKLTTAGLYSRDRGEIGWDSVGGKRLDIHLD